MRKIMKIILPTLFVLMITACGGEENTVCAQGGKYESCIYTLDSNGCAAHIDIKKSWNGSLTLNLVDEFCSKYAWTEGPFWKIGLPGTTLCEVNVTSSVNPVDVDKLTGVGIIDVNCDTFHCSYQASFKCER